jgi:hypothetical protein
LHGRQAVGGFSVAIQSARLEGNQVTVRLVLHELGRDEVSLQGTTSPFTVAVIRELDSHEKAFSFVAELDWEVVDAG